MKKVYPEELFESIAKNIHNDVEEIRVPKKASLIGITITSDGTDYTTIKSNPDVYQLLESPKAVKLTKEGNFHLVALLTAGWAAPNDDINIAPSEHPDRKRVEMTMVGNTAVQYGSVLSIEGQDQMYDYMTAEGSLSESFEQFMENVCEKV